MQVPVELEGSSQILDVLHDKLVLVIFHSDRCPHCLQILPTFNDFGYEYYKHVLTAAIDCDNPVNRDFCVKQKVTGLPTIYLYNGNRYLEYDVRKISVDDLRKFVKKRAVERWGRSHEALEFDQSKGAWRAFKSDYI